MLGVACLEMSCSHLIPATSSHRWAGMGGLRHARAYSTRPHALWPCVCHAFHILLCRMHFSGQTLSFALLSAVQSGNHAGAGPCPQVLHERAGRGNTVTCCAEMPQVMLCCAVAALWSGFSAVSCLCARLAGHRYPSPSGLPPLRFTRQPQRRPQGSPHSRSPAAAAAGCCWWGGQPLLLLLPLPGI